MTQQVRKDSNLIVRITTAEKEQAMKAAERVGKPVSELIRELLRNVKTNQA